MNNSDFPLIALIILSFFAGFACAIWLAVTMDRDARKMVKNDNANDCKELP